MRLFDHSFDFPKLTHYETGRLKDVKDGKDSGVDHQALPLISNLGHWTEPASDQLETEQTLNKLQHSFG